MSLAAVAMLQGCVQCAEAMRGTPEYVQAAYAHSIELLAATAFIAFGFGVWYLVRSDRY